MTIQAIRRGTYIPKFDHLSDQTLVIYIRNSFGKKICIFDVEEDYKLRQ